MVGISSRQIIGLSRRHWDPVEDIRTIEHTNPIWLIPQIARMQSLSLLASSYLLGL